MIENLWVEGDSAFKNFYRMLRSKDAKIVSIEDTDCGGVEFDPHEILEEIRELKRKLKRRRKGDA